MVWEAGATKFIRKMTHSNSFNQPFGGARVGVRTIIEPHASKFGNRMVGLDIWGVAAGGLSVENAGVGHPSVTKMMDS